MCHVASISVVQHLHESLLSDIAGLMQNMMERQRQELDTCMGKVSGHGSFSLLGWRESVGGLIEFM